MSARVVAVAFGSRWRLPWAAQHVGCMHLRCTLSGVLPCTCHPVCLPARPPSLQRCVAHHPDAAGPQAAHTQRRGAGQPDGAAAPALLSWRSLRWQAPPRLPACLPACLQALHATLNNEPHESSPTKVAAEKLLSFMSLVSSPLSPVGVRHRLPPPFNVLPASLFFLLHD